MTTAQTQTTTGVIWNERGYGALTGPSLRLYRRVESLLHDWTSAWDAEDHLAPPFIPAATLDRVGWFQSFPHLCTIPVTMASDNDSLLPFADRPFDADGALAPTRPAPACEVLTPAACYHLYPTLEGTTLAGPRHLCIEAPCFRREARYEPLRRQWGFHMREVVCLGTADDVRAFLELARTRVDALVRGLGLEARWLAATDPFFEPRAAGKLLLQKLAPVKTELVVGDGLAIASLNFHQAHFGEAFAIFAGRQAAFSGCVAFGLERWVAALLAGPERSEGTRPLQQQTPAAGVPL